jgi:hypothetical protein
MALERVEIRNLVSDAELAEPAASTAVVKDGRATVHESHPGYSWVWTDEIRCQGKDCGASLAIPLLESTKVVAHRVFADHQQKYLEQILESLPLVS